MRVYFHTVKISTGPVSQMNMCVLVLQISFVLNVTINGLSEYFSEAGREILSLSPDVMSLRADWLVSHCCHKLKTRRARRHTSLVARQIVCSLR